MRQTLINLKCVVYDYDNIAAEHLVCSIVEDCMGQISVNNDQLLVYSTPWEIELLLNYVRGQKYCSNESPRLYFMISHRSKRKLVSSFL